MPFVESAAKRLSQGVGLCVDFLLHEAREVAQIVGVGRGRFGRLREQLEGRDRGPKTISAHGDDLAVAETGHLRRAPDEGCLVGGDDRGALGESDHDGAAVARDDELVGEQGRQNNETVGADHERERGAYRVLESRGLRAQGARNEVRQDLGVGLRSEAHAVSGELGADLVRVLDDAVVHHGDSAGLVDMGMGVGLGGLSVGGPPRVRDADCGWVSAVSEATQIGDAADGFRASHRAVVDDGQTGRVVAPILEALQTPQAGSGPRRGTSARPRRPRCRTCQTVRAAAE